MDLVRRHDEGATLETILVETNLPRNFVENVLARHGRSPRLPERVKGPEQRPVSPPCKQENPSSPEVPEVKKPPTIGTLDPSRFLVSTFFRSRNSLRALLWSIDGDIEATHRFAVLIGAPREPSRRHHVTNSQWIEGAAAYLLTSHQRKTAIALGAQEETAADYLASIETIRTGVRYEARRDA